MLRFVSRIITHQTTHYFIFLSLLGSLLITSGKITNGYVFRHFPILVESVDLGLLLILLLYCAGLIVYQTRINKCALSKNLTLLLMFALLLIDLSLSFLADVIPAFRMEVQSYHFLSLVRILVFFVLYYEFFPNTSFYHIIRVVKGAYRPLLSVLFLLSIVLYAFALISHELFAQSNPDLFGTLSHSIMELFHMIFSGTFGETVKAVAPYHAYATLFFLTFILICGFVIINLFITVLVGEFSKSTRKEDLNHAKAQHEELVQLIKSFGIAAKKTSASSRKKLNS